MQGCMRICFAGDTGDMLQKSNTWLLAIIAAGRRPTRSESRAVGDDEWLIRYSSYHLDDVITNSSARAAQSLAFSLSITPQKTEPALCSVFDSARGLLDCFWMNAIVHRSTKGNATLFGKVVQEMEETEARFASGRHRDKSLEDQKLDTWLIKENMQFSLVLRQVASVRSPIKLLCSEYQRQNIMTY